MDSNQQINSIESWDAQYLKRITISFVLSIILHVVTFGVVLLIGIFFSSGSGLEVLTFDAGAPREIGEVRPLLGGINAPDRIKIFRVDFFSEIIPWSPPAPEPDAEDPAPVEEIIPEPVIEEPDPIEVDPGPEPEPEVEAVTEIDDPEPIELSTSENEITFETVIDIIGADNSSREDIIFNFGREPGEPDSDDSMPPEDIDSNAYPGNLRPEPVLALPEFEEGVSDDNVARDNYGTFASGEETDPGANVVPMPDWVLTDMDGIEWNSDWFLGNYTIYILGDITTRHGHEDILAWDYVLRQLVTNPYAEWPPNITIVATGFEQYYRYDEDDMRRVLKNSHDEENTFGVQLIDPDGQIPMSLGYTELPVPIVLFVDNNGYLRLALIGRIRDISNTNIQAAMDTIADMWQWSDEERDFLPTPITLLINLLRDTAYDKEIRLEPPVDSAYEKAPTWGYPYNYEELITLPAESDKSDPNYVPF